MNKNLILVLAGALALGVAEAKLPPPTEEAKVKAEEAKAKAAQAGKVANFQLCKAQNRVAERYMKEKGVKGSAPPACQDPGAVQTTAAAAAKK